ncbi:hypothetical protein QCN29_33365 [Streptomyces sp. HNM0663]|uniref:Uncharacterized protein n=1 Tax=Streptomyces chengmaiensis TaxID=3040919 RepID=A0ABT6HXY7_9ACTN|nr:hypothetical protein [Streptomyces chengmaiensis]MDH2393569.1 hypothetical protein [Streptomyces chengmaiensis]
MPDEGNIEHSHYDFWRPDPNAPQSEPEAPDPDHGKDLGYLVPNVSVSWGVLPSFNNPPPGSEQQGGGDVDEDVPATPPIRVDLSGVRATEITLISAARTVVDAYQGLREHVLSVQDDVFGQNDTDLEKDPTYYATSAQEVPSQIQPIAREFAASMNPAMERALYFMGTTLELFGEYIALINRTGQTYSEVDRNARFPTEATNRQVVT